MSPSQLQLLEDLMVGKIYLMKTQNANRKQVYKLYTGNMNPVGYLYNRSFKAISRLLKQDKLGRHTLNLSTIRREHGNSYVKKLYKHIRNEQSNHIVGRTEKSAQKIEPGHQQKACTPCVIESLFPGK